MSVPPSMTRVTGGCDRVGHRPLLPACAVQVLRVVSPVFLHLWLHLKQLSLLLESFSAPPLVSSSFVL